jgi:hypothetical protein
MRTRGKVAARDEAELLGGGGGGGETAPGGGGGESTPGGVGDDEEAMTLMASFCPLEQ